MPESNTPDLAQVWTQLETTVRPGLHSRRLDPRLNLSATIHNPDRAIGLRLAITQPFAWNPGDIVGSDQIEFLCSTDPSGSTTITLMLRDDQLREMFLQLCDDLVPRVLSRATESAAATTLIRRFSAWQRFLKRSGRGMSAERQRGLYGELLTLNDLMIPNIGPELAIQAWTGPSQAPQDFQTSGIAIEVKTIIHSEPQQLKISGERQLDDFGVDALLLAHHRIASQQGSGQTLPELIESVRVNSSQNDGPLEELDDKLLAYGYADVNEALYTSTGYAVRSTKYYRVRPGFPRLTESDLFPGIGGLKYLIDASACVPFTVDSDDVGSWLRHPPPSEDPATTPESIQVEHKQTAWTPTRATTTPKHRSNVVAGIKTAIVKTVVAFMNSIGGELVIGVEDSSQAVTGIEPDLTSRGQSTDDFDYYERALLEIISDRIDRRAPIQLRIHFKNHDTGTTCHVAVRPSPSPRFGRPFSSGNNEPTATFWIRSGNATVSLEGHEMTEYISEHWT